MRGRPAMLLATAALLAPLLAGEPFPYSLALDVDYGDPPGPRVILERFSAGLARELAERACFERVSRGAPDEPTDADLRLRVTLERFEEVTRFEATVAQRADPVDPATRQALVAEFGVTLRIELLGARDGRALRGGTRRVFRSVRPLMPGHDETYAREEARSQGLQEMIQATVSKACKGSAKKLEKLLARPAAR